MFDRTRRLVLCPSLIEGIKHDDVLSEFDVSWTKHIAVLCRDGHQRRSRRFGHFSAAVADSWSLAQPLTRRTFVLEMTVSPACIDQKGL